MSVLDDVLDDLAAEGDLLQAAVSGLAEEGWASPTPAPGWSVATQVAHLAWTDETALAAAGVAMAADPDDPQVAAAKQTWDAVVLQAIEDPDGFVDAQAHEVARLAPAALLSRWGRARQELARGLRAVPAGHRLPWFGPPMSPTSMATARFMETWAHSLDVREALGLPAEPTDRVRHVAHLGVRTRDFAHHQHQVAPPAEEFRVELTAPSGATWTWGPDDAAQQVRGSAWDFARLVTQRVHRDDTDLEADGVDAERWLGLAQAFAGPPGVGREAGRG